MEALKDLYNEQVANEEQTSEDTGETTSEVSTSSATPGYNSIYAWQGGSEKNRAKRKKSAETSGMTVVGKMDDNAN